MWKIPPLANRSAGSRPLIDWDVVAVHVREVGVGEVADARVGEVLEHREREPVHRDREPEGLKAL